MTEFTGNFQIENLTYFHDRKDIALLLENKLQGFKEEIKTADNENQIFTQLSPNLLNVKPSWTISSCKSVIEIGDWFMYYEKKPITSQLVLEK